MDGARVLVGWEIEIRVIGKMKGRRAIRSDKFHVYRERETENNRR